MAAPKIIVVKETVAELKKIRKALIPMLAKRIDALLLFKTHQKTGIAKRQAAQQLGVDQNSIQKWRSLYLEGGLEQLLHHDKIGFRPSVFTKEQQQALQQQMHKADNGFVGFIEFLDWFNTTYNTTINYKTFHGFVVRKFSAKVKTARKVHVKKDPVAVEAFKKNSRPSVKASLKKKR